MRAAGEQVKCRAARVCVRVLDTGLCDPPVAHLLLLPAVQCSRALPSPSAGAAVLFRSHAVAAPAVSCPKLWEESRQGGSRLWSSRSRGRGRPHRSSCAESRQGKAGCAGSLQHPDVHLLRLRWQLRFGMPSGAVCAVLCLRISVPVLCLLCLRAVKSEVCYAFRCCVCCAVPAGPCPGAVLPMPACCQI